MGFPNTSGVSVRPLRSPSEGLLHPRSRHSRRRLVRRDGWKAERPDPIAQTERPDIRHPFFCEVRKSSDIQSKAFQMVGERKHFIACPALCLAMSVTPTGAGQDRYHAAGELFIRSSEARSHCARLAAASYVV